MNTLIPMAAAGVLSVVMLTIVLISGRRARMPVAQARGFRLLIAILGAFFITMVGWVFYVFGIHRHTPVLTTLAFLGVPVVQALDYLNRSIAVILFYVAFILGLAGWAAVLYVVLSVARIPGQRPGAEAQVHGPRRA